MKLRRYALFLVVAILTFVIGVSAALLFGGVTLTAHRSQGRATGCRRMMLLPDNRSRMTVYTVYREDGTIVKSYEVERASGLERLGTMTGEDEPPQPPPPAYVPPAKR